MSYIICDLETIALPDEVLKQRMPDFAPKANLSDPAKIELDIEQKRKAFFSEAALSAFSGQIAMVNLKVSGENKYNFIQQESEKTPTEADVLHEAAGIFCELLGEGEKIVGFCSKKFDWPMFRRRCWVNGVDFPDGVYTRVHGRDYYTDNIIDLLEVYSCGVYNDTISLSRLGQMLGVGNKSVDGSSFGEMWANDRAKAIEYSKWDLDLTDKIAELMMPELVG